MGKCFNLILAENKRWICLSDPPPEKWIRETSRDDDELFLKLTEADT
ncbi:MAG: hypothetical protein SWH68_00975 [Thermodesulfobacteriota bacterium]|nr:hypothetical protein [Thermodesulfobacteriota bacterium]